MANEKPTVNLSTVKEGDILHFRCGGSAVIKNTRRANSMYNGEEKVLVTFKTPSRGNTLYESVEAYFSDGSFIHGSNYHPFDIVRIEPKAFDWDDAKAGMAFKHNEGSKVFYFVAHDPSNKDCAIFSTAYSPVLGFKEIDFMPYNLLSIRAPEHDIMITEEEEEGG